MKKIIMPILLSLLLTLSFTSNAFAASIGQISFTPDNGWKRIDDSNSAFVYTGSSWYTLNSGFYNSTTHVTTGAQENVKFKFQGTKLRIISETAPNRPTNVKVSIDGKDYTYSGYGAYSQEQVLVFEVTDLVNGIHSVTITNPTQGKYMDFDAIDIDDSGKMIDMNSPYNLKAVPGDGQVTLNWDKVDEADSYIVHYGTASGNYTKNITVTKDSYGNYVIPGLTNGTTYYFVVSSVIGGVESVYSNEATAIPLAIVQPNNSDRAILTITMTTGLEKEFDLPIDEVQAFLDWYDTKDAGSGPSKYAINKHNNNKGPFSKRTEYVIFDKILTFEVSEYTAD
ncbi:Amylopullulanase precursor [compost metagenome]